MMETESQRIKGRICEDSDYMLVITAVKMKNVFKYLGKTTNTERNVNYSTKKRKCCFLCGNG